MFESPERKSVARAFTRQAFVAFVIFSALQLFTLSFAFAANPAIFDVRISLPMEPDEPAFHDFYINAGPEAGFKKGMYVTVVRSVPIHDPIQNKQQGELPIEVARLQIIQVASTLTVARLVEEFTDEDRPTLEYESVMIGDKIDLATLNNEAPKKKAKANKRAEAKTEDHSAEEAKAVVRVEVTKVATDPIPAAAVPATPAAPPPNQEDAAKAPPPAEPPQASNVNPGEKNPSPAAKSPNMVRVPVPAVAEKL